MGFLRRLIYGRRWTYTDANGVRRPLYDHFETQGNGAIIDADTFDSVRRTAEGSAMSRPGRAGLTFAQIVVGAMLLLTISSAIRRGITTDWLVASAIRLAIAAAVLWVASRFVRAGPSQYATALLAHGRCAFCGYPLPGSGRVVCPECGAEWQIG